LRHSDLRRVREKTKRGKSVEKEGAGKNIKRNQRKDLGRVHKKEGTKPQLWGDILATKRGRQQAKKVFGYKGKKGNAG